MWKVGLAALCALMAVSEVATAQEDGPRYVIGAGSCRLELGALRMADRNDEVVLEQNAYSWIQGYMSGLNSAKPTKDRVQLNPGFSDIFHDMPLIVSFCNEHPNADFSEAARLLYTAIQTKIEMQRRSPGR